MSAATWLDPIVTTGDTFLSLNFMRGDDTDDTPGLQSLLAAVRANGGGRIVMQKPPRRYRFVATGNGYPGAQFPSNTEMYGEDGAEIFWTGSPKRDDFGGVAGSQRFGWLDIEPGSSAILIRDLIIRSDNTPFVRYFNNQSSGIMIQASGHSATHDVMVRDCAFLDHAGFPVHAPGGGFRIHTVRNAYTNCANGENNNADYSVHYRNRFVNTESLEGSGACSIFAMNDFSSSFTNGAVLSLGGNTSRGARVPGSLVVGNSIANVPGLGIIAAEAFVNGFIQGNVIDGAGNSGIQIGVAAVAFCDHNAIVDNVSTRARYGINVFSAFATDTLVAGNSCTNDFYAFLCSSPRATVIGNTFSGSGKDVFFNVADSTVFAENAYDSTRFGVLHSAAFRRVPPPSRPEVAVMGDVDAAWAVVQVRNWSSSGSVRLDLSGVARHGEQFAIYHPYDLLGAPVARVTYLGSPVRLSMTRIQPPTDWTVSTSQALPPLGPRFGGLVVVRAASTTD